MYSLLAWKAAQVQLSTQPAHATLTFLTAAYAELLQENCPECLGLPEEVAHTKQALKCVLGLLLHSRLSDPGGECCTTLIA